MIQRIQTIFLILVIVIGYVNLWQDPVYAWFSERPQQFKCFDVLAQLFGGCDGCEHDVYA